MGLVGLAALLGAPLVVLRAWVELAHEAPVGAGGDHRRLALLVGVLLDRDEGPEEDGPPRPLPLRDPLLIGLGVGPRRCRRPDLLVHGHLSQEIHELILLRSVGRW